MIIIEFISLSPPPSSPSPPGRRIWPGSLQESGSDREAAKGNTGPARVCQCFMLSVRNPYYDKGLSTVGTPVAIDL
eukprot:325141-Rhodomonas_salina.1